jgi:hypothetical protein
LATNAGAGAIGYSNKVVGFSSQGIGAYNTMTNTSGGYNYLFGYNNSVTGTADQNVLIGQNATSSRYGTVSIASAANRINLKTPPAYANVAAANADATLITGDLYTIASGGGKQLWIK